MFVRLITILCVSFLTACAAPKSYYPQIENYEIAQERKRQEDLINAEKGKKKEKDTTIQTGYRQRLASVGARISEGGVKLCRNLNMGSCVYDFVLSRDKGVNAAADGSKIEVTMDMMDFAGTDEELAVVLGHEYAHNLMGHIKSAKTNIMIGSVIGTVIDLAASTQGISTGSAFSKAGSQVGAISYSKEFEKEADYIGLYVTALAGYDIANAPNLWRRMSLEDSRSVYVATTHPTNPERYLSLEKTVEEIERKQNNNAMLVPGIKQ